MLPNAFAGLAILWQLRYAVTTVNIYYWRFHFQDELLFFRLFSIVIMLGQRLVKTSGSFRHHAPKLLPRRRPYNLYCVGRDVKPYSINLILRLSPHHSHIFALAIYSLTLMAANTPGPAGSLLV